MFFLGLVTNHLQQLSTIGVCSSNKMIPIYFLRLCKVWSILHQEPVGQVLKKMLLNAFVYFQAFFVAFHHKICVFIIFISFFSYLPNFRHTILTNQKHDLVASNCQQNCLIPSVCYYLWTPFFKNNHAFYIKFDFWFEKRLFLKYFEISLKIFSKHFLILLVPYILRTSF